MNEAMRKACIRGTPEQLAAAGLLEQHGSGFRPPEGTVLMTSHNYGLQQPAGVVITFLEEDCGYIHLNSNHVTRSEELEVVVFRPESDRTSIDMMRYASRQAG